jgi:hypothetical protein
MAFPVKLGTQVNFASTFVFLHPTSLRDRDGKTAVSFRDHVDIVTYKLSAL